MSTAAERPIASTGPLAGIRVLDLTDQAGMYCGKLLADLGADVILVEPRTGSAARRSGPFLDGTPDPNRSLTFWYLNTSKRGITLDLENPDGVELFRQLARGAGVVIEDFPVGYLEERGVGYRVLAAENPALVMTSVTPFGRGGPWEHYRGGDLVAQAVGGQASLCGFPNQSPVKLGGTQGFQTAAQQAAVGTLIAVYGAEASGHGQHVDVSMQEAVAFSTQPAVHFASTTGEVLRRQGNNYARYGTSLPCKDGFVAASFNRADVRARAVDWLEEEGLVGDLRDPRWEDSERTTEFRAHILTQMRLLCADRTKLEIAIEAQKRKVWMTPVYSTADLPSDPHLRARGYFMPVEHDDVGRTIEYPGAPYKLSETPSRIYRRPPRLGEHNREVYAEIGVEGETYEALLTAGTI